MKDLLLAHLRAELKRRNITNADIAERLGKNRSTVSNWLYRGNITVKKLEEILIVYGIKIKTITFE